MATSARRIRIPHPDLSFSQKTYLSADYTSGTAISVKNNDTFAANQIAVVGEPGQEKTESKPISGVTGDTVIDVTGALSFAHNSNEVLYRSEYNQIEVSYNTGSGWSVLATIDIQWDQRESIYVHQSGVDGTSYRFRFYNSASTNFSEYSPTILGSGFAKNQAGFMVNRVRKAIRDPEKKIVTDLEILRFLSDAKNIIKAKRNDWWFWKVIDETGMATVASSEKYDLDGISSEIEYIRDIRYKLVDGSNTDTWPLDSVTDIEYYDLTRDNDREDDDHVEVYNLMPPDSNSTTGYIRVYPTPETTGGTFYVDYYENEGDFTSLSDTTKIPLTSILEDYAIAQCERIKGNVTKESIYEKKFYGPASDRKDNEMMTGIALLEQIQGSKGRPVGKPRSIRTFRGRKAISRYYRSSYHSRSQQDRETYY